MLSKIGNCLLIRRVPNTFGTLEGYVTPNNKQVAADVLNNAIIKSIDTQVRWRQNLSKIHRH